MSGAQYILSTVQKTVTGRMYLLTSTKTTAVNQDPKIVHRRLYLETCTVAEMSPSRHSKTTWSTG